MPGEASAFLECVCLLYSAMEPHARRDCSSSSHTCLPHTWQVPAGAPCMLLQQDADSFTSCKECSSFCMEQSTRNQ